MTENVVRTKYEEYIQQLESLPIQTGKILLYGSSFFAHWGYERSHNQLNEATNGKLDTINHAFGGSMIDELLYYYPRLVKPYAPKAVVIRSGYNEISGGMEPRDSVFLLERLVSWMKTDFPEIPILILKTFHCKKDDEARHNKMLKYNQLLEEAFADVENVKLLYITPFFYDHPENIGDRTTLRDVFVPDGLHLHDEGYSQMAHFLGSILVRELSDIISV